MKLAAMACMLSEGSGGVAGIDVSIRSLGKLGPEEVRQVVNSRCAVTEKYDGTKLTLYRNGADWDEDPSNNWIVSSKGKVLYPEEFAGANTQLAVDKSTGFMQYSVVFGELDKIHARSKELPKNTELFCEFIQRKPTITRQYQKMHGIFLIGYARSHARDAEGFFESSGGKMQMDHGEMSKITGIPNPPVIFFGTLNSRESLLEGARYKPLTNAINSTELDFSSMGLTVQSLYKVFTSFESTLGGKPEGVVIESPHGMFKLLQGDQHDRSVRAQISSRMKSFTDEQSTKSDLFRIEKQLGLDGTGEPYAYRTKKIAGALMNQASGETVRQRLSAFTKAVYALRADPRVLEGIHAAGRGMIRRSSSGMNALYVGRFQPMHAAHADIISKALELPGVRTVMVAVVRSGSQERDLVKNPFSFETQARMIKAVFPQDSVRVIPVGSGYLPKLIREVPGIVSYYVCGGDRAEEYSKQVDAVNEKIRGHENKIKLVAFGRVDDVSGTQAREALKNGDRARFDSIVPEKVRPMYEDLREELLRSQARSAV